MVKLLPLIAALAGLLFTGCASSRCHVLLIDPANKQEHPDDLSVTYAGARYKWGGAVRVPNFRSCHQIPEHATLSWANEHGQQFNEVLPVRGNMPPGFLSDRSNAIVFRVDKDDRATVGFLTKLSDLTTKEIYHPETDAERRQRHWDEALWRAVVASDLSEVNAALGRGASVVQPWMSNTGEFKGEVLREALREARPEIVEALLQRGRHLVDYFDFTDRSAVWNSVIRGRTDISLLWLRYGANPDYRGADELVTPRDARERVLFLAAESGNVQLVRALLEHGASTDFALSDGTPFQVWLRSQAPTEVRALFK